MKLKQIEDFSSVGFEPIALKKNQSLSLVDAGLLYHHLLVQKLDCDFENLLSCYRLKWSKDLKDCFDILPKLSKSFLRWAAQKDLGLNEFKILVFAMQSQVPQTINSFLETFTKLNPTRQIGARILEYYFELTNPEIGQPQKAEELLETLYSKRFPQAAKKDTELAQKVQAFPWPAHIKAKWLRQGDRAGIEIKFFATSAEDFKKKISALNDLKDKSEEKIWN